MTKVLELTYREENKLTKNFIKMGQAMSPIYVLYVLKKKN